MKNCVIHVGMHKTGTSSLQQSFYQQLDNDQWLYPIFDKSENHNRILGMLFNEHFLLKQKNNRLKQLNPKNQLEENEIIENFVGKFTNERQSLLAIWDSVLSKCTSENVLISGEILCSLQFTEIEIAKLRDTIKKYSSSFQIIGYVRSPKSYMESAFQQTLKTNNVKLNFNQLCIDYRKVFEKFDKVFSKENVNLRKFDPASFPNSCVVQDFCKQLNIGFPVEAIKKTNESLSHPAVCLLYTYRHYAPLNSKFFSNQQNHLLVNHLTELSGDKFKFAPSAVMPIIEANKNSIKWLEERIGITLDETIKESETDIHCENDLFQHQYESLQWLAAKLSPSHVKQCRPEMPSETVAFWMYEWHSQLVAQNKPNKRNNP